MNRKRRDGEPFDEYRRSLKEEQHAINFHLRGRKLYEAITIHSKPNPAYKSDSATPGVLPGIPYGVSLGPAKAMLRSRVRPEMVFREGRMSPGQILRARGTFYVQR